jgi:hypothetical protein
MPKYQYTAQINKNRVRCGHVEAGSEIEAFSIIAKDVPNGTQIYIERSGWDRGVSKKASHEA